MRFNQNFPVFKQGVFRQIEFEFAHKDTKRLFRNKEYSKSNNFPVKKQRVFRLKIKIVPIQQQKEYGNNCLGFWQILK